MADWLPEGGPRSLFFVLISGVVAALTWLANLADDRDTVRRDVYARKEDCVQDWGDERNCEQEPAASRSTGHGAYYYGPTYRSGQYGSRSESRPEGTVDSARPGSHAIATGHVTRGGFGASGAAHGASGS
jgi:uncharacterized protein YgiB involved in biofilm formation